MQEQCLQFWEIPDEARTLLCRMNANKKARTLLQDLSLFLQLTKYTISLGITRYSKSKFRQSHTNKSYLELAF